MSTDDFKRVEIGNSTNDETATNEEQMKRCTRKSCSHNGELLPLTMFQKDSNKRDGLACWCRTCRSESSGNWRKRNPEENKIAQHKYWQKNKEKINAKIKKWNASNTERSRTNGREYKRKHAERLKLKEREYKAADPMAYWLRKSFSRAKNRAKNKGVAFSITREDLLPLPEFCCVFGIKLDYLGGSDRRARASVDRIVPVLGYVKGNVRIISYAANSAKQDGVGDIVISHNL